MLVSREIATIDAIHSQLQGSSYGLVVVTNPTEVARVVDRLTPRVVLWDGESFSPALVPPVNLSGSILQITEASASPDLSAITLPRGDLALALLPTLATILENRVICARPLTLLLLHSPDQAPALSAEWHQTLQNYQCCLLQAEDIEQARLLCRIWQPDAIVLDQQAPPRAEDLIQISRLPDLAAQSLVLLRARPEGAPDLKIIDARTVIDRGPHQGAIILLHQISPYRTNLPLPRQLEPQI